MKQLRHNAGKIRLSFVPAEWIVAIGEVLNFGLIKYARNNWRKGAPPTLKYHWLATHSLQAD